MYRIAQIGVFDYENYGDLLFPEILCEELGHRLGEIYIDLFSPKGGVKAFSDISVYSVDELDVKCKQKKYDAIVVGGGDLIRFGETVANKYLENDNNAKLWITPVLIALKYNIPIYFNAPGVPFPFNENEKIIAKYFLDKVNRISVRDAGSREYLAATQCNEDIYVVPDTVWNVKNIYSEAVLREKRTELKKELALPEEYAIFQFNSLEEGISAAEHAKILEDFAKKTNLKLVFMPIGYVLSDDEVMKNIFEFVKDRDFSYIGRKLSPFEMLSVISGAKLFVGTSLHGSLTSSVYDVPCIGINHFSLNKINGFFDMTGQMVIKSISELGNIATLPKMIEPKIKEDIISRVNKHFDSLADLIKNKDNYYKNTIADLTDLIALFSRCEEKESKMCTIYFDKGDGFNEADKLCYEYYGEYISLNFEIPDNVKRIRFDPIEGVLCAIKGISVICGTQKLKADFAGAVKVGELYIYTESTDPNIYVNIPEITSNNVIIEACVYVIDDFVGKSVICNFKETENAMIMELADKQKELEQKDSQLSECSENLIKVNTQLQECKKCLDDTKEKLLNAEQKNVKTEQELLDTQQKLTNEIQELNQKVLLQERNISDLMFQNNQYYGMYMHVINSACWKVTKPIRMALDPIKAIPIVGKSLRCIRLFGIKGFFKKALSKVKKNKPRIKIKKQKLNLVKFENQIESTGKTVSVVIPTFNGEEDLKILLKVLRNQKGFEKIQLVIVDSGSKDNTVELCKEHGAKVIQIKQEEFSHSYARNLGGENADGEYLLIMTQDALPSSDRWLYNLYCALEYGDNIAAVSCREFVKNDADLYYRVFTAHHYSYLGVLENDAVFTMPKSKDSDEIRQNSQLSDITCFMRHETFLKYKYRGGFAEDLDLGMRLIEDGYNLAFLGNEVSIHSHNRNAYYYLKRRFVELKTLEEIFSNQVAFEYNYQMTVNETVYILYHLQKFIEQHYTKECLMDFKQFRQEFDGFIRSLNQGSYPSDISGINCKDELFDEKTGSFFAMCLKDYKPATVAYEGVMVNASIGYFDIVMNYMEQSYEVVNKDIADEFAECCYKILTGVCGTFFAYSYLSDEEDREKHIGFYDEIGGGV